jgi:hypothetical protein
VIHFKIFAMKILLIISITLTVILIAYQIYLAMSINKTETQAYRVIRVEPTFEIRYYPAATMAMISSQAKTFRELGSSGFAKLAKYIFGGNNENKQIAMTTPVHMEISESNATMAFVLPAAYNTVNLPTPNDNSISIKTSAAEYVAVIQFGGFASIEIINKQKELLAKSLQEKGLHYHGNFRFLGYNPPFQIINRKNEVIVAIDAGELQEH